MILSATQNYRISLAPEIDMAIFINRFIADFELGNARKNTTKDNKTQHFQKTSYGTSALSMTYVLETTQRCVFRFRAEAKHVHCGHASASVTANR
jgi:hypothetical protein